MASQYVCPIDGPVVPDHVVAGAPFDQPPHCPLCGSAVSTDTAVPEHDVSASGRGYEHVAREGEPVVGAYEARPFAARIEDRQDELEAQGLSHEQAVTQATQEFINLNG